MVLLLVAFGLISGCKKNKTTPAVATPYVSSVSYKVDGVLVNGFHPSAGMATIFGGGIIIFSITESSGDTLGMFLEPNCKEGHNYVFNNPFYSIGYNSSTGGYSSEINSGNIYIATHNVGDRIVEGTFSGTVYHSGNHSPKVITQGLFKMQYQ